LVAFLDTKYGAGEQRWHDQPGVKERLAGIMPHHDHTSGTLVASSLRIFETYEFEMNIKGMDLFELLTDSPNCSSENIP